MRDEGPGGRFEMGSGRFRNATCKVRAAVGGDVPT